MNNCLECGNLLSHVEGRKKKMFCNQVCKGKYWRKNNPPKKENKTVKMIEEILMSEKGISIIFDFFEKIAQKSNAKNRKLNTSDMEEVVIEIAESHSKDTPKGELSPAERMKRLIEEQRQKIRNNQK